LHSPMSRKGCLTAGWQSSHSDYINSFSPFYLFTLYLFLVQHARNYEKQPGMILFLKIQPQRAPRTPRKGIIQFFRPLMDEDW